jgi:hypothetical protein
VGGYDLERIEQTIRMKRFNEPGAYLNISIILLKKVEYRGYD